jgi:hypothetical protein
MIKIIQSLKSNYIQIVYSEGTYGEGGRDAIRREARLGNICIKKEIVVKEGESYAGILSQLRVSYFAYAIWIILRRDKICEDATLMLLPYAPIHPSSLSAIGTYVPSRNCTPF